VLGWAANVDILILKREFLGTLWWKGRADDEQS
jgi:hypothetical protein